MFPTLLIGDHYYVDPRAFHGREPQRGEVVVFAVARRSTGRWDFNGSWAELLNPAIWWDLHSRKTRWDRIGLAVQ
jgi:hypothetical protein